MAGGRRHHLGPDPKKPPGPPRPPGPVKRRKMVFGPKVASSAKKALPGRFWVPPAGSPALFSPPTRPRPALDSEKLGETRPASAEIQGPEKGGAGGRVGGVSGRAFF